MKYTLECKVCDFEYTHLIAKINIRDDDNYNVVSVWVNNKYEVPIRSKIKYQYRSQESVQLLFICESGHYFHKSFDGHKGNIYVDQNIVMDELCEFLNEKHINEDFLTYDVDFKLLANIEEFFNKTQE